MAAITITTPTYLDGGTTRVAGDTYTINGTTFTIRTDTRVHANAPASMTGSLNNITVSSALGGTIVIDGTQVRWMPFTSGSGNVPAIGTLVTQGGVSGYLLGVWADYVSAPLAPAAAMPATGYLKFREVTGGSYSAGALAGINASAASTDVAGWIEIAMDSATSFQAQELGGGLIANGTWFYLDNTSGTRGQQINVPTNGGGTGTHVFAVQIETAPGSGIFEWYGTAGIAVGASNWTTANIASDIRAKIVESMGNGVIRIGSDGTNSIGYLPPAGCRVRIPNILGRTAAVASRSINQVPGAVTRAGMTGANFTLTNMHADFTFSAANIVHLELRNYVSEFSLTGTNNRDPVILDNCCIGGFTSSAAIILSLNTINGLSITNTKIIGSPYILGAVALSNCTNVTSNTLDIVLPKSRTAASYALSLAAVQNSTFVNTKLKGAGVNLTTLQNVSLTTNDYIDRLEGNTTAVVPTNVFNFAQSTNVTVDGVTFGENGTVANTQPYGIIFSSGTNPNFNIKMRNMGTRLAPVSAGSNASFYPSGIASFNQAGDTNIKLQRLFITATRASPITAFSPSAIGVLVEDVYSGSFIATSGFFGRSALYRKVSGIPTSTAPNNTGTHWVDVWTSDTAGAIRWYAEAPNPDTSAKNYLTVTPSLGTGYIASQAAVSLDNIADELFSESDYWFYGHTSFKNVDPVLQTNGARTSVSSIVAGRSYAIATVSGFNFTTVGATSNTVGQFFTATATQAIGGSTVYGTVPFYQLDTGSGFSGVWKLATGANLSAETVSPTGFKMRLRIVQSTAEPNTAAIQWLTFSTNTTAADQAATLYPLDTVSLSFAGLVAGTEVRAYVGTDPATAVEIGGTESTGGTTFSFTHSSAGQIGYIAIFAIGYQPIYLPYTYTSADSSLLIQQVIDRNYYNP